MAETLLLGKKGEAFSTLQRPAPSLWVLLGWTLGAAFCSVPLECHWHPQSAPYCYPLSRKDPLPHRRAAGVASPGHLVLPFAVVLAFLTSYLLQ